MYGKFPDPNNKAFRLYGEVLSTHRDEHFVRVTKRNAREIEPFNMIVKVDEFLINEGANKGYWRKQLRGKDGKWIEMGGGIEWGSGADRRLGTVTGFDDDDQKVIVTDSKGEDHKLSADELKRSATKAVIPEETTTVPDSEDLELFVGDKPLDPAIFDYFPVGGEPLEIKDKQGNIVARVRKVESEEGTDTTASIIIDILRAILPRDLFRAFAGRP